MIPSPPCIRTAAPDESEPDRLFAQGWAALKARDAFAAVAAFEAVRRLVPTYPGLDEALLAAYRRDARYADAIVLAEAILARDAGNAEAWFESGMSRVRLGEAEAALTAFDRVVAINPEHAAAWYNGHGPALDLLGLDEALRRLERAATRERANGRYWALPHAYCLLAGRKEEAEALYRRHLARYPNRRTLNDGLSSLLPHRASECRVFGVSAHLLRFGLEEAREEGMVLEFGVRRGTSLAQIARLARQPVHGFDSFEGLPEGWVKAPAGALTTGAEQPLMAANVTLHPGWFERTLPDFLAAQAGPVRFVNLDSDLYSSTRTVLFGLRDRLRPGSVLVFDEMIGNPTWREDEYKAFAEFQDASAFAYEVIALAPFTKQVAIRLL